MKTLWYKKAGWVYIPMHVMGLLVTLNAIIFLAPVYLVIVRQGHSASGDLYQIFVYTTCTAFWWNWIAEKTS